eukprot:96481-Amphidinium_carterae.1
MAIEAFGVLPPRKDCKQILTIPQLVDISPHNIQNAENNKVYIVIAVPETKHLTFSPVFQPVRWANQNFIYEAIPACLYWMPK